MDLCFYNKSSDFQKILLNAKEERKIFSECYTFIKSLLFELSHKPKTLAKCLLLQTKEELDSPKLMNLLKNLTNTFFDDFIDENAVESRILHFIYIIMQAKKTKKFHIFNKNLYFS